MPEVDHDLVQINNAIITAAKTAVNGITPDGIPNKYHVAMAIIQNRALLDAYVERSTTDQVLNSILGIVATIAANVKADQRLIVSHELMANSPSV